MPELDEDTSEREQIRDWHQTFLLELGCSWDTASTWADGIDPHAVALLIRRGCPPDLAVEIAR